MGSDGMKRNKVPYDRQLLVQPLTFIPTSLSINMSTLQQPFASTVSRLLAPLVQLRSGELRVLLMSFACAALMFTAYSMLRPVRDAMGVTSGVRSLPVLFWATFAVTLILQPVYGWLLTRFERSISLPVTYVVIALSLVAFNVWYHLGANPVWLARTYYVWVSVFVLFLTAIFWSLMADVFSREQAARLFAFIAGGLSVGGLLGPAIAASLAKPLGAVNLLLIAATMMLCSAWVMRLIVRSPQSKPNRTDAREATDAALHVSKFDAFRQVAKSPYLVAISVFVVFLTFVSTIIYIELQRVVGATISGRDAQTQFFATVDFWVQAGSLTCQFLLFPRLLRWFGFTAMLAAVPLMMAVGFGVFAAAPVLAAIVGTSIVRRIGEYGITRPSRDMLFTVVPKQEKYMAKSLIDTFIYRGGDAVSASIHAGFIALTASTALASAGAGLLGVAIALIWLVVAVWLARQFNQRAAVDASGNQSANQPVDQAVGAKTPANLSRNL
jgi:ATP:ADP antiporter, AAA family